MSTRNSTTSLTLSTTSPMNLAHEAQQMAILSPNANAQVDPVQICTSNTTLGLASDKDLGKRL